MSTNMQESFADLFEASLTRQEMRQGEVITAEIVRIDQNFVVVNAGLKSESYIDRAEFLNDQGDLEVQIGDFVQVAIEQLENGFGETRLKCTPESTAADYQCNRRVEIRIVPVTQNDVNAVR